MNRLFFTLLAAIMLIACDKEDGSTPSITNYEKDLLHQTIYADETGAKSDFTFTATENWSTQIMDISPDSKSSEDNKMWVTLNPANGTAGIVNMKIALAPNYTGIDRKAEIKIVCGSTTITITIEQKRTTENNEVPKPLLAQISKITYTSIDDEMNNKQKPSYYLFAYDSNGRITKLTHQYQNIYEPPVGGGDVQYVDIEDICNITYQGDEVTIESDENYAHEKISVKSKLNSLGYIESSTAGKIKYRMTYNSQWQIEQVIENSDEESTKVNSCLWSNENFTKLTWANNGNEFAQYNTYLNNITNLDLNWLLKSHLEGFAFLDGSDGNYFYAIQNKMGVRSKNYVSAIRSEYTWNSNPKYKFEYEFDNNQRPIKIKEYRNNSNGSIEEFSYEGCWTIEYK